MTEHTGRPHLTVVGTPAEKPLEELRAEIEALKYENQKLKSINAVLVQRVELGWGNFSTAYSSFQRAAMLTEQVASKSRALQKTRSRLDDAQVDLSRTAAERDLSQQRLADLIETIPDAVALFDTARVLVMANASFFAFWRHTGAMIEPGRTHLSELGALAVTHGLFDRQSRDEGRTTGGANIFKMADGRWLQMAERTTADDGLVVVYTDVTAVKDQSVEQVGYQPRDLTHDLLEHLPQGVALIDADASLRVANQRFIDVLNLGDQQWQGRSLTTVIRQSQLSSVLDDDDVFWLGCNPSEGICQRQLELGDGTVLDMSSHPLASGTYLITLTDISERSRDAQAIRENAHRLRLMTDSLPALIAFFNCDELCEFANRTFGTWYDQPREALEGSSLSAILGEEEYAEHKRYIVKAMSGVPVSFEIEQVLPDGRQRIFTKSYVPNRNDDGEVIGFFALEQDATEQRRTASALKHAYRHMEQRVFERTRELSDLNDKLHAEVEERAQIERHLLEATKEARQASESKVKFMAAAGHDLLQPLNAARLFASSLIGEPLPGSASKLVTSLSRSLDDVESIITTLVDISKLEAGVVEAASEAFNVNELLSALADEFSALAAEAGLGFHYIPSSVPVHSDSQLLARVLRNLLTNALRYTESGRIVLGCRRRPHGLDIEVADTGIGIPEDQLGVIFGEFQRAPGSHVHDERGLGLGLAIVDKLSSVLGCRVSVRSLPSKGSVFTVCVPYGELDRPVATQVDAATLTGQMSFVDKRVLVVDNDAAILEGMRTLLERWGCDVRTARNLSELDSHLTHGFEPALALLDYQLDDDLTGFTVASLLAERLQDLPGVVMITANHTRDLRMQAAASGYILLNKPVRPHKLRNAMTRLLV